VTKKKKTTSAETETPLLSKEEVFSVLEYANLAYSGGLWQGIYTPQLVNARLQESTMAPIAATAAGVKAALASPKESERELAGFVEWGELNSILFKRILRYFSGLMSFDWNYICTNVRDPKEYTSPAYVKDLLVVQDFFDRFNVKQQFKIVMNQITRNEAFFAVFRDDGDKYVLQEWNKDYAIINGRFDYGLLFSVNLYWFLLPGVSLEMYPPVFTKMFNEMFKGGKSSGFYNPAGTIDQHTSQYVYWADVSPLDGFVCFKGSPELGTRVPMIAPLLSSTVNESVVRDLQMNSYIAEASKLLYGQVPLLKDAGTKLKDQIAISSDTLGKFLALMQAALSSVVKLAASPLENVSAVEFKGSDTILSSYLQTAASSTGVNSRLIFAQDRQNILETKMSMDIDQNLLRPIYSQFEDWLAFTINRRTKKYKFKFNFSGFENVTNREERLNIVTKMAEFGIVSDQMFAQAWGLNPFDLRRMMDETKATGFVDKLTPIQKASQLGNAALNGRPQKSDAEISDSGEQSRGDGSGSEKNEQ
jgi:hypothetical protein